jgi:oxygen-independent coproporphyrinogen-3 oxidase
MSGIYLHIPFCKQKCHYCNFFSVASLKHRHDFIGVLKKEIALKKDYLENEEVRTIYFGGGTPSLLVKSEIEVLIEKLTKHFNVIPDVEITLEANPDDLDRVKLNELRSTPVNRLSIGIQSFHDDDLVYLNRVHNNKASLDSILLAKEAGFKNLTIDLIYGIPTLTLEKWHLNLEKFFELDVPHLSAYSLTIEPKTALAALVNKKKLANVDEEESIRHFELLLELMEKKGYTHYEISNFSKPGFYSKHNSLYWLGGHYLGLGPSAHSFNGKSRHWNVSNLGKYMGLEDYQSVVEETEVLTPNQKYNEYVMTSLRTVWGCDTEHINNVFGNQYSSYFLRVAKRFIGEGKIRSENNKYYLTDIGKLFADGIASEFFLD